MAHILVPTGLSIIRMTNPTSPSTLAVLVVLMAAGLASSAIAQEAAEVDNEAELAKKLTNPVANLVSVPIQYNRDASANSTRTTVNIQPVIPFSLNAEFNLITRTIFPIISAESPLPGINTVSGLGDVVQSFFFSPKEPTSGGWIWGAGPVLLWPSGSDVSARKWGIGPTALVLMQDSGFTYGMLANHISSYAGGGNQAISATFVQPFLSYTTKSYTTLGVNTESTYDWKNQQWTVPINATVSQMLTIGGQPISLTLGYKYYATAPTGGPDWGLRLGFTMLFPK